MINKILYKNITNVELPDREIYRKIRERWDRLAKPIDSLGKFEDIVAVIGSIRGTTKVDIEKRILIMICADNGIVGRGVTQSGQEVTKEVAEWMGNNKSSVCIMAKVAGVDTLPVDVGINMEGSPKGVLNRKVRRGTKDFLSEPAMSDVEFEEALNIGIDLVRECVEKGYSIIATGEMGIGNTTTASAVCAALLGCSAKEVTGRGAGIPDSGYVAKIEVINKALFKYGLSDCKNEDADYAKRVAMSVGGLDIVALAGVYIGGLVYRIPIIIDGFISAVAALLAERLIPGTREIMIPSHMGKEKGMKNVLKELKLDPPIDASLALGEGSGAIMLFPLLDMVLALYGNGYVFEETKIQQYDRFEDLK
ncbi:MAG: nicotinate-nucleotide--dimethylbenzimidazole phosphoribosyltransferase [Lachnospiraceae bacterium]|nr:nicotinate-nucleotide--dimethylbenzimidazole phosphoribosyltransferase [Lachnospiraceae bacterium]